MQAEVVPCLLIKGGRKFHIRTYLVIVERALDKDIDMYIFNRHEVRVAGVPVDINDTDRNRLAHITNGALSNTTERILLSDVPELTSRGVTEKVEKFVAQTFAKHLLPDISRRVSANMNGTHGSTREFCVAGLDLMVTEEDRIYLLEVNANPAAPPNNMADDAFSEHLVGFMHDLIDVVLGRPSPNFLDAFEILERDGI